MRRMIHQHQNQHQGQQQQKCPWQRARRQQPVTLGAWGGLWRSAHPQGRQLQLWEWEGHHHLGHPLLP